MVVAIGVDATAGPVLVFVGEAEGGVAQLVERDLVGAAVGRRWWPPALAPRPGSPAGPAEGGEEVELERRLWNPGSADRLASTLLNGGPASVSW
jgi:hypothetical protein